MVCLCAEIRSCGAGARKVAGEERLHDRAEHDLGATKWCQHSHYITQDISSPELRQGQPKSENEFKGVVEGKPVDSADSALQDTELRVRFSM